jgi:hypothetical protein
MMFLNMFVKFSLTRSESSGKSFSFGTVKSYRFKSLLSERETFFARSSYVFEMRLLQTGPCMASVKPFY